VTLEFASTPGFKLFSQCLVETTHATFARSDSHEGFCNVSHLLGTRTAHKHVRYALCHLLFITIVPFKELGMELSFAIPGNLKILDLPTGR
jgi:hypothetical protein